MVLRCVTEAVTQHVHNLFMVVLAFVIASFALSSNNVGAPFRLRHAVNVSDHLGVYPCAPRCSPSAKLLPILMDITASGSHFKSGAGYTWAPY